MELLPTFLVLLSPAVCSRDITMYLVLSAFTSSPISLVATARASAFSFTVCQILCMSTYFRKYVNYEISEKSLLWELFSSYKTD